MTRFEMIALLKNRIMEIPIMNIIGSRLKGKYGMYLCPFHDDHTPQNFKIHFKNNTFKCYACETSGSAIDFIMLYHNLTFSEAVLLIAKEHRIITEEEFKKLSKGEAINNELILKPEIEVKEKYKPVVAEIDDRDNVYRIFMKGQSLFGKSKLSEEDYNTLKNERFLPDEEIEECGYFTFPNEFFNTRFQKELVKNDIDLEILKHIPGFYLNDKTEKFEFKRLKNMTGIGIPIPDIDGKIEAIQIRKNSDSNRYEWFSSIFADGSKGSSFGTSPGAPVAVIYPPGEIKTKTIFITEGYFKARELAKTFNSIVLSVQGVGNWKNIIPIVTELKNRYEYLSNIMITYDADMSRKEAVLRQGLKLGIALTGLNIPEDVEDSIEEVLTIANRTKTNNASKKEKEAQMVSNYLNNNKREFDFNIYYCLWDENFGKGIDDLLFNGKKDQLKKVNLLKFWGYSFEYLKDVALKKISIVETTKVNYKEAVVSEEDKIAFFNKNVFSKI